MVWRSGWLQSPNRYCGQAPSGIASSRMGNPWGIFSDKAMAHIHIQYVKPYRFLPMAIVATA